ncbi:MAG: sulfatase [Deltaproteobacteria bacterium]|nr:sulfatase [Deltaproteobacteria bacterium]
MRTAKSGVITALALSAVLAWLAWPAPGPNVLLITVDGLRPDRLSCYGGAVPVPNLDWLAANGVLFQHATTDVPWTTPALATIMTGVGANRHQLRLPEQRLSERFETLAQRLQDAGWTTAAVVGAYPADHTTGLARGFGYYEDRYNAPMEYPKARIPRLPSESFDDADAARNYHARKATADSRRTDEAVTDAAIGWLKRHGRRRFLLWVHYFGAQEQRDQLRAAEIERETLVRQYPEHVVRVDREIGHLIDSLDERGWSDDTLVVVLGSHGQDLREHFFVGHGANVYEPGLRLPWVMRFPGRFHSGQRVAAAVQTADVLPTILARLGVGAPAGLSGRDALAPDYVAGDSYAETYLPATAVLSTAVPFEGQQVRLGFVARAVRSGSWKLIRSEPSALLDTKAPPPVPAALPALFLREELYDLANDPGETQNLLAAQPQIAARLRQRLREFTARGEG